MLLKSERDRLKGTRKPGTGVLEVTLLEGPEAGEPLRAGGLIGGYAGEKRSLVPGQDAGDEIVLDGADLLDVDADRRVREDAGDHPRAVAYIVMDMRQARNEGLAAFLRADIRIKPFRRDVKAEKLLKAEA